MIAECKNFNKAKNFGRKKGAFSYGKRQKEDKTHDMTAMGGAPTNTFEDFWPLGSLS